MYLRLLKYLRTMKKIRLRDKTFREHITYKEIEEKVRLLASRINADYAGKQRPLFLGVLNGSFMFMAELVKNIDFDCEISFVKIASYEGTMSSGSVTELIGMPGNLEGRHVIVVEDIVDTGASIEHIMRNLRGHNPASVAVATLLFKPEAYKKEEKIDYPVLSVPDLFVVGFGLDYDQLGRNLTDIYILDEE